MNVVTTTEHHVSWKSPEGDDYEVGIDSSNTLFVKANSGYSLFDPSDIDNILKALTLIKEKITNG